MRKNEEKKNLNTQQGNVTHGTAVKRITVKKDELDIYRLMWKDLGLML